jgi:Glucodextranase, domain B/PASTA domain
VRRLALLALPLALVACGGTARPAAGPRVALELSSPDDAGTVRAESVQVRGTVQPADAEVEVDGESAEVDNGTFSAEVPLSPGANVIDVTASAAGHRADADALRITRDMRVELPDLVGMSDTDATAKLEDLGMKPRLDDERSFLDRIIPGELQVCSMSPGAGELVNKQTTVTLAVANQC